MPLDFSHLTEQISIVAKQTEIGRAEATDRSRNALDIIRDASENYKSLSNKIEINRRKYTWLVPQINEPLTNAYDPPNIPENHVVVATDGSQIDVDTHAITPWYLLNIGTVNIRYGTNPSAHLQSTPQIYGADNDLVIVDPENHLQRETIEGNLLGYKREVEEVKALIKLIRDIPSDLPILALLDGSLVLWGLAGQQFGEYVRKEIIEDGLLTALEELYNESKVRPLYVASYISLPNATEVVNTLRIKICEFPTPDCDQYCREKPVMERPCDQVAQVLDRHIFQELLQPGQRSTLFASRSSVVDKYYGIHRVLFFYLNTGNEIARIEIPQWVAEEEGVNNLHGLLNNQVRLGNGYPVSLAEAHEQAIVRVSEQDLFWQLVNSKISNTQIQPTTSQKSTAKRQRWT
ncbi:MAG: DNA double-strand break repair nuclease NurA [SAR202 cluster bacterium]|nr:DNA double-strand break repair nuclease NurA [SAR202 cluster bacterium]|tara:strand:- start:288 stop:1502 length:1215 start_codon:yes stop_codon:yes gene_type:complete